MPPLFAIERMARIWNSWASLPGYRIICKEHECQQLAMRRARGGADFRSTKLKIGECGDLGLILISAAMLLKFVPGSSISWAAVLLEFVPGSSIYWTAVLLKLVPSSSISWAAALLS